MDNFKGETRQALLNRAFLYIVLIGFSFFIFLRVRALLFDLFVAVVLSVLAEPIVYRLSKRFNRRLATIITVATIIQKPLTSLDETEKITIKAPYA